MSELIQIVHSFQLQNNNILRIPKKAIIQAGVDPLEIFRNLNCPDDANNHNAIATSKDADELAPDFVIKYGDHDRIDDTWHLFDDEPGDNHNGKDSRITNSNPTRGRRTCTTTDTADTHRMELVLSGTNTIQDTPISDENHFVYIPEAKAEPNRQSVLSVKIDLGDDEDDDKDPSIGLTMQNSSESGSVSEVADLPVLTHDVLSDMDDDGDIW